MNIRPIPTPALLFLLAYALLAACTEIEEPAPFAPPNPVLLSSHDWILASVSKKDERTTVNEFAAYPTCTKDDLYVFTSAGSYSVVEGNSACQEDAPSIKLTGTWTLENSVLVLQLLDEEEWAFSVTKLTEEELVTEWVEMGSNGKVVSVTTSVYKQAPVL